MAKEELEKFITEHNLTFAYKFVPWSLSRNAKENTPSLNYTVTLNVEGNAVITIDYAMGYAHCPSYAPSISRKLNDAIIKAECETGKRRTPPLDTAILPSDIDVLHCLALDAQVIDHKDFEDWASNYGFDTDSRKAEQMYRACLETATKLRAALGEEGLNALQEACQDY